MEKLISCLEKLTKLILESLKSTDLSKESGTVYFILLLLPKIYLITERFRVRKA